MEELELLRSKVNRTADGVPVARTDKVYYYIGVNDLRVNEWEQWLRHIAQDVPDCYSSDKAAKAARKVNNGKASQKVR